MLVVDSSSPVAFLSLQVVLTNPDVRGRQEILDLYLQDKPLSDDVDVKSLARGTPGFSGAGMMSGLQYF